MNLPIDKLLTSGVGIVVTVSGFIGMWFRVQNKVDNLERKDTEQDDKIKDIVRWSHSHEKEAADQREQINRNIYKIEGALLVTDQQFKQIMDTLKDMKEQINDLMVKNETQRD